MAKPRIRVTTPAAVATEPSDPEAVVPDSDILTLASRPWKARGCPEGPLELDWIQAGRILQVNTIHNAQVSEPLLVRGSGA